MNPSIEPLGDSAALVAWRSLEANAAWNAVQSALANFENNAIEGIIASIPAFDSLTVYYDCRILTWSEITKWITDILSNVPLATAVTHGQLDIPVCYDEEFAIDLTNIAAIHDLSTQETVRLHSNAAYVVRMIGFSPGFPYLAGLPVQLHTPRRASPRISVPTGSVAIGGKHTGIYSRNTPGGWHIIGRTPVRLFEPDRDQPCLLRTGDTVRFFAIDRRQFDEYAEKT